MLITEDGRRVTCRSFLVGRHRQACTLIKLKICNSYVDDRISLRSDTYSFRNWLYSIFKRVSQVRTVVLTSPYAFEQMLH